MYSFVQALRKASWRAEFEQKHKHTTTSTGFAKYVSTEMIQF